MHISIILLLKSIKAVTDKKIVLELFLCFISVIGFFTISFFDFPKERMEHLIWINLIFGFAYYLIKEHAPLTTIFQIASGKWIFITCIAISLFVCIIGSYRYKGELHTRKMYDQKARNNINA